MSKVQEMLRNAMDEGKDVTIITNTGSQFNGLVLLAPLVGCSCADCMTTTIHAAGKKVIIVAKDIESVCHDE